MYSIPRRGNLVILVLSCLCVGVLPQRTAPLARIPGRQPICVATTCTYTVDIGLADCNGRQLTCLPLSFNQAINMDMGQNSIHRLPRGMLTGYMRIRSLDLSNNVITIIEDGAFDAMKTLRTLTLSFNRITRLGIGTFTGLRSIQNIYLQGNRIMSMHANTFTGLSQLQELNLAGNRLATLPHAVFSSLFNLRRLMLQENQLRTGNRFLTGLRSLVELDLDGNRFTTLPDLSGMHMLSDLEITDSNIRRIKNNSFAGCWRIKELILTSNSIDTIDINGFSDLRELTDLHLSFNALQTIPEEGFSKLLFLERLYLQNNMLTSLTANHFATLTSLRVLSLSNNQLSVFPPLPASRLLGALDLTSNNLSTLTKNVLLSFPVLNRLLLLHNPLQCDCRLTYLRQWFINSGLRHRSNEIPLCDSPVPLSSTRLTAAPPSGMICTPPAVWARVASVNGLEGRNITLDCSGTSGFPSPTITWRSPTRQELLPDIPSGRYLVSDDGPMVIIRATKADSGLFTCVGSNPAGIATVAVALKVNKDPNLPVPTAATEGANPVTPVVVDPSIAPGPQRPVTQYIDLVTPPVAPTDNVAPATLEPDWDENPRLPGGKPPHSDDDSYRNGPECGTHPTKVAAAIFLTFFLTCILCTIFFWSWYHRLLPRLAGRSLNLTSLKNRRMSRNIVPLGSRAARAYNQMQSEGIYMRPGSYSGSEHSDSTSNSFENDNRYVITGSNVDPDSMSRRQHMLNKISFKPSGVSGDSRHTYINADVAMNESNYTALCTSKERRRSSLQITPPEEHSSKQLQRKSLAEMSVDSRIYMDLS